MKKNKEKNKIERFNPDISTGLTFEQVEKRTSQKLTNKTKIAFGKSYAEIIFTNVLSFFNILLFVIAGVMAYFKLYSGMFFLCIILPNMFICLFEDIKARALMGKLRLLTQPKATVVRDGRREIIETKDVVLDEILFVAGDAQICVDGVLLDGAISVNESLLTGESHNIYKKVGDPVFSGTYVVSGTGYIKAEKVGKDCYAHSLQDQANKFKRSPSQILRSFRYLFRVIGAIVICSAIFLLLTFYFQGKFETKDLIISSVKSITGSMVAMIPCGLYLLTSMALAAAVLSLGKRKAQVQDFYSIEMLARTNVLCVDKTGTITDGSMDVKKVFTFTEKYNEDAVAQIVANILSATQDNNLTAKALRKAFPYESTAFVTGVLAFSSDNKYSAASFRGDDLFVLGAPEFINLNNRSFVLNKCKSFTTLGYRVMVLAHCNGKISGSKVTDSVDAIALIILKDHVREDAIKTFKWFNDNGVEIKVISGDNAETVSEVAKTAGIMDADKYISLEGKTLDEVREYATLYNVFGRVTPEQKEVLIQSLKDSGKTVAMTGDGVNDILALKRADCSIAMAAGADAARNVSHIVLLDSNFDHLPEVVAEGRRVINNLQRTACLFLAKTIFAMSTTLGFTILSLIKKDPNIQYPFITNHLYLWEIIASGISAFFIALEPNKEQIKGSFLPNVFKKTIPAAIMIIVDVAIFFAAYALQSKGYINFGVYNTQSAVGLSVISFSTLGLVYLYKVCKPLDKYRTVVLICAVIAEICALGYCGYRTYSTQAIEPILQIPFLELNGTSYIFMAIVTVILASIYLLGSSIVETIKGDNDNVED